VSEYQSSHLVGMLKNFMKDHGLPKSLEDIGNLEFRSLAAAHVDEFDEARDEFESDLSLA
jgi:hypothetical protein